MFCMLGGSGGYYGLVFGGGFILGMWLIGCGVVVFMFRFSEGYVRLF